MSFKHLINEIEYLVESTLPLSKDVDYIYKKFGFDKIDKAIKSNDIKKIKKALDSYLSTRNSIKIKSSELKGQKVKQASKVNPINILTGKGGSFYDFKNKYIFIGLNDDVLRWYFRVDSIDELSSELGSKVYSKFKGELRELALKGVIAHELNHWVKDSLHGNFISKIIHRAGNSGNGARMFGNVLANQSHVELDSQVQAIKEIRRLMGGRAFNKLSWYDLIKHKTSLRFNLIGSGVKPISKSEFNKVMKKLVKRLAKENLLGKKMQDYPDYNKLVDDDF